MGSKSTGKKVEWLLVLLGLALLVLGAMYMFGFFLHKVSDTGTKIIPFLLPPKQAQQQYVPEPQYVFGAPPLPPRRQTGAPPPYAPPLPPRRR